MRLSLKLQTLLKPETSVCVLTGAGISAESGVPTFRDKEGLWAKFKPEELASFDAFMANPKLVWEWYQHRREVLKKVKPNPGHEALVTMERYFSDFTLVTQNVDGLHKRAGSQNPLELHGNIERNYCAQCREPCTVELSSKPPSCTFCGGLIRPDVVWFGETLPLEVFHKAETAAARCQLFFCVGTAGAVFPAAGLPLKALENGAHVVEINNKPSELSPYMSEILSGPAGAILPKLVDQLA